MHPEPPHDPTAAGGAARRDATRAVETAVTGGDERAVHAPGTLARAAAVLAAATLPAAARAGAMALRDGYLRDPDLRAFALRSVSLDLLDGLVDTLPAAAVLWLLLARTGRGARVALLVAGAALGYAFVVGRVPRLVFHAPGWDGGRALAAHAAGALVAVASMAVLASAVRPGRGPDAARGARATRRAGAPADGVTGARATDVAAHVPRIGAVAAVAAVAVRGAGAAAALTVLAALCGAALLVPGRGGPPASWPDRPNVILVSLDTLRADHLGCYGYPLPTSPELDAFAAQGVRFERAYTPQPWTLTAHMSLLTGLNPSVHGVREETPLPRGVRTLAEAYRDAGYLTAAVVDPVVWLDPRYGFARGFDVFQRPYGRAELKNRYVRHLLDDLGSGPFFLFLHYYDAHSDKDRLPYDADPPDAERFASWYDGDFTGCDERGRCASELLKAINAEGGELSEQDARYLASLYDAGVRSLDRQLGALFDELERRGQLERSIVVVTSDHGEAFLEHGEVLHGELFEHTARVPLLVRTPDTARRAARDGPATSDALVSLVDVAPTLAELSPGVRPGPGQGRSFASEVRGGAASVGAHATEPSVSGPADGPSGAPRGHVVLDTGRDVLGVHTGTYKLVHGDEGEALYDLTRDPGERRDLLDEPRASGDDALAALLAELRVRRAAALEETRRLRRELGVGASAAGEQPGAIMTEAEREALRALGYLGEGDG